jgi:hypothetical protein
MAPFYASKAGLGALMKTIFLTVLLAASSLAQAEDFTRLLRHDVNCVGEKRIIRLGYDLSIAIVKGCVEGCGMKVYSAKALSRSGGAVKVEVVGLEEFEQPLTITDVFALSDREDSPVRAFGGREEFECRYLP